MSGALSGRRILLTRPEGQVEPLAKRLHALGAETRHFPAIKITPIPPDKGKLDFFEKSDLVIFASVNAVRGLMEGPDRFVEVLRVAPEIAAIGPATAEALQQANLEVTVTAPPPHNSEALLSTKMLHTEHLRVTIVRGQSGREKLAKELRHRGAKVDYLEVYHREPPTATLSLAEMPGGPPEAICVTSVEIAENLVRCVAPEERTALLQGVLIAGNARIAAACRKLGYTSIAGIADNPGDNAMIKELTHYFTASP